MASRYQPGRTTVRMPLSGGDRGTSQTIDVIRELVSQGREDLHINQLAGGIVRRIDPQQPEARARALYSAVQRRVKFVPDIVDRETLRPASVVWQQGFGDCDDVNAVLLPSLLMTVGFPVRLVTIAADADDYTQFSHIYAETEINGGWIPVDLARPGALFGRDPGYHQRRHVWSLVDGEDYEESVGVNGLWNARRLGLARVAYLGQDEATDIATVIAAGGVAATDIIAAQQGNTPFGPGTQPLPAGYTVPQPTAGFTISGPLILLLLIAGIGFVALKKD
jgi:hypothetical protein